MSEWNAVFLPRGCRGHLCVPFNSIELQFKDLGLHVILFQFLLE